MEGQIGLAELIDALIADFQERDLREEGTAGVAGGTVRIVPAWRWLLEPGAA